MNDEESSSTTNSDESKLQGLSDGQMLRVATESDPNEHDKREMENAVLKKVFTNLVPNDPFKQVLKTDPQSRSSSDNNESNLESPVDPVLNASRTVDQKPGEEKPVDVEKRPVEENVSEQRKPDEAEKPGGTNRPEEAAKDRSSSEEASEEWRTDDENGPLEERVPDESPRTDEN